MAVKQRSSKLRKKKWVNVLAPKMFGEQPLGESYVYETESLVGRFINFNLMTLTNDFKKQNIYIKFQIKSLQGSNAVTEIVGYRLIPSAIKRMIRRDSKKIEESFIAETQDKVKVQIKSIIITRMKVKSSVSKAIRAELKESVARYLKKTNFERLVSEIISNKLQSTINSRLSKLYPLRFTITSVKKLSGEAVKEDIKIEKSTREVDFDKSKRGRRGPPRRDRS